MKYPFSLFGRFHPLLSVLAVVFCTGVSSAVAQNQRALGLDISAWQGNISQTTWNNVCNVDNRQFVVLRSSRGGTTGYYNQNDAANNNGQNTLSQRYDDPYFIQNVNRASAAGMFVGTYHFSRPDIITTTLNANGIPNNGTDEADHFIQMAGAWMRPGYLPPVHDLEAGISQRTSTEQAQFALDFSNRIYEKMGIRPAVYTSGSYAADLTLATAPLPDLIAKPPALLPSMVSPAYPALWSARWPYGTNAYGGDIQTDQPKNTYTPIYGPWDDYGVTHPWVFWQYTSHTGLPSYNNGNTWLDLDVAQGGTEFLKDNLVPAVWWSDLSGQWTTLTNWNSGQTPVQPVAGPGQVAPVATGPLPTPRLPSTNDTIILERPDANITVTLASGNHNIRKLYVREALDITGGSLTINYTPSWDSTTNAAQFSAPVSLSNAALNVHTLQVDAAQTFSVSDGTLQFSQIKLMQGITPAVLAMNGNASFNAWSNGVCNIVNGAGPGSFGNINLGGGTRTFSVANDADLSVDIVIQNGGLTKNGNGTLRLTGRNSYTGGTIVSAGKLWVNNTIGSGTGTGSVTVNGGVLGGTGIISGVATINSDGTLAPGTDAAIGTLTFEGSPVLNGTNFFRVNRNGGSPVSDKITRSGGPLTFGGKLIVNHTGLELDGGEVFTLFSATSYNGAFTATNAPALSAGLNWYWGNLAVDGTLRVNSRPVVNYTAFQSAPGQTLAIPKSTLIANSTDAEGDILSLVSFDPATTNGITLSSDSTNIYYLNNADVPDQFSFMISDGHGGNTIGVTLIGQDIPVPPSISSGPASLTVLAGQNASFAVGASGTAPLSYQWRFNGTNIASAFATNYTRVNVQPTHSGGYTVVVTNGYGSITSSVATLTVVLPAAITVQPQSTNVFTGQNVTFNVGASGTGPIFYQWRFQSNPIIGQTTSNLVLNSTTTNQSGGYSVIVSNAYFSVTSQVATLTITPPRLQILWQLPPGSRSYLTINDLPEQRGMTYNSATRHLLVLNRLKPSIHVLDADTGANLWTLNTNSVASGLNTNYHLLLIAAADDGVIYACNLIASAPPFKIYRWADDNSNTVPTVAFSGTPSPNTPTYRYGDTFDVRGSGTNTQILIGPRMGTNVVLFTTTNLTNFTPRVINLNGMVAGSCGLNLTFGNSNTFWGTTHTNELRRVSLDTGSTLRFYSDTEIPSAVNPIGFSSSLNLLAGIHVNSPNHLRVYDLSPTNGIPYLIGTTNFSTDNSNTHTGTGALRFSGDTIYALDANNGLMAVRVLLPNAPLRFNEMSIQSGQQFILRGTGAVGNYVVECTSDSLTNWTPVANVSIDINGTFQFQEPLINSSNRFYRIRKQ